MSKYDLVIWDFNGTIIDDLTVCMRIVNELMTGEGLEPLSLEEYREVFRFPIEIYYDQVGLTKKKSFETQSNRFMALYNELIAEMSCYPASKRTIIELAKLGVKQMVLSASHEDTLRQQLVNEGLLDCFETIMGLNNNSASGKLAIGLAWLEQNNHKKLKKLLIGDTTHDFELAQALGADCLLLAIGHESKERLLRNGVPVLDDPALIVDYVL